MAPSGRVVDTEAHRSWIYSRRIWQEPILTSGKAISIREVTPKGEEVEILLRHHDEEQKNKSPSKAFRRTVLWTLDQQAGSRVERIGRTVVNRAYEPRQLDPSWFYEILGEMLSFLLMMGISSSANAASAASVVSNAFNHLLSCAAPTAQTFFGTNES